MLEAGFGQCHQCHWPPRYARVQPSTHQCSMISLNQGVGKRYLVDIAVETELLIVLGMGLRTRGSTSGGMLGCWAEIGCCQPVSQKIST